MLQVQWAFLAGLAVVIALVPLNRWLAGIIQRASQRMMAAKDERIRLISEMLRGIRQIKLAAWEPIFLAKVLVDGALLSSKCFVEQFLDPVSCPCCQDNLHSF